jgi:hypothetical protein
MDLQQRSVIRYYILCKIFNKEIHTKLSLGYGKDAFYQRTVDMWTTRVRSGRKSVEDDKRPGRPSRDNFSFTISDYLEGNPHAPYYEIAKNLFVPMSTISQILEEIGWKFFIAN